MRRNLNRGFRGQCTSESVIRLRPVTDKMTSALSITRTVKVALISQSEIWTVIRPSVFSDFCFQWDAQDDDTPFDQPSAKIVLDFIDFTPDLYGICGYGNDPYKRPFLNFYVVEVRAGRELSESQKDDIVRWAESAAMTQTQILIVILQEMQKFKNKAIDVTQFYNDTSNILVIPVRSNKLTEESKKQIQQATRSRIIADFQAYLEGTEQRIEQLNETRTWEKWRLKVWRGLLLYFFGFDKSALVGFIAAYEGMIKEWDQPLDAMLKLKLDNERITLYPFTMEDDPTAVLMFALHGILAVRYCNSEKSEIVDLFFQYFAFLRSKCVTEADNKRVDEWGEEGIKQLLLLRPLQNDNEISSRLHLRLFALEYERDGDLASVYNTLMKVMVNPMARKTVQAKFLIWCAKHGKQLISLNVAEMDGWSFGAEATSILFDQAMAKEPLDVGAIKTYTQILLADRTPCPYKRSVLERAAASESTKMEILNPFALDLYSIESDAFWKVLPVAYPFETRVRVRGPQWIPTEYDEAAIVYELSSERHRKKKRTKVGNTSIDNEIVFPVHMNRKGTWKITLFQLRYKNVMFSWTVNTSHAVVLTEHSPIPTTVTFPKIITPTKPMQAVVQFDMTQMSSRILAFSLSFRDGSATIPAQQGTASCQSGATAKDVPFTISESGALEFESNLSLFCASFPLEFSLTDPSVEKAELVIASKIDNQSFESLFTLQNSFPLTCQGRMMAETMLHLCLRNTCDVPLYVSNETIGEMTILPNEATYLLQPRTAEFLTLDVHEKDGETVTKTWPLDENVMMKRVNADLDKKLPVAVGAVIRVKVSMPACSSYEILGNPDLVIVGQTRVAGFKGGEITFRVIALRGGTVEMPVIVIDKETWTVHPQFIDVACSALLSYSPFV